MIKTYYCSNEFKFLILNEGERIYEETITVSNRKFI